MRAEDKFYYYHSSIGDLTRIIKRNILEQVEPTDEFITNAFGVKIRPDFFPGILTGKGGVEPPPIPANWHADIAEFAAALRAVELSNNKFTVVELGCGWGCWLNITGVVAKRKGLNVRLIGVEGDAGHVNFALTALSDNGFNQSEYRIHHGVAAPKTGTAMFPIQNQSGVSWGLEPVFNAKPSRVKKMLKEGTHQPLPQISLADIGMDSDYIDLLHIDIQGGEIPLIPDTIDFLNRKVSMILIGTHGRVIEGQLFEVLIKNNWRIEIERPAVINVGKTPETLVDGVQLWRNPRLISDEKAFKAEPKGAVKALDFPVCVQKGETFELKVEVKNESSTDWLCATDFPVRLSYHWIHEGETIQFEGIRTSFFGNQLNSGESSEQVMTVHAPLFKGKLDLMITIVQDGIFWFDNTEFNTEKITLELY